MIGGVDTTPIGELASLAMESVEHHNPDGEVVSVGIVVEIAAPDGRTIIEARCSEVRQYVAQALFSKAAQTYDS